MSIYSFYVTVTKYIDKFDKHETAAHLYILVNKKLYNDDGGDLYVFERTKENFKPNISSALMYF